MARKLTKKEIIVRLCEARDAFNKAANKSVGEQQAHLTMHWAHINDMMQVVLGNQEKLNEIVTNAQCWDAMTSRW